MGSTIALVATVGGMVAIAGYLFGELLKSIKREKGGTTFKQAWRNFGLSMSFAILFLLSWVLHGVAEWQTFVDQQHAHRQPTEVGDFLQEFSAATLENWQSEFLQLFSFTVLSAVLIHKGSAESRDSDDEMQQALARIEKKLQTSRKT